ncbi:hypothetical protein RB653_009898 [Dictyostelium firmibasis]|uniref:Ketosynthase family 3 (KS3) domain-containing protein n=1 Tax=Dictyostelium firmibasis TaxID=79012 RepID=A0AAN7TSC5_9MYCE
MNQDNNVAIIGIGLKFPGKSNSTGEFWENLINKNNCTVNASERFSKFDNNTENNENFFASLVESKEWDNFNSNQYNIDSSIEQLIDPQLKQILNCTTQAINDANLNENHIKGSKTSCFIGSTSNDFHNYLRFNKKLNFPVGSTNYSLSNMVSFIFDLRGPSMTINSACSSSLNSICQGYESIINGDCEYSICGGSNYIFDPEYHKAYIGMGIVTKGDQSKSYDEKADGFVRGEGVGIIILKKLDKAIIDNNNIYAIIKGVNNNCDGSFNKPSYIYPSKEAQANNINQALLNSKLKPNQIDYFEANAPGMPFLDSVELATISMVFNSNDDDDDDDKKRTCPLLIGTYKPNMGHLEGASGIGGFIKCCLMYKFKMFAPTLLFNNNISSVVNNNQLKLVTELTSFKKDKINCVLNNFGATGSNCSVVLSNY